MSSHPLIGTAIERSDDQDWLNAAPTDWVEQRLVELESVIASTRSEQARLLSEIDRRQVPTGDGCRSLDEWIAGRLDVSSETAAHLRLVSRRPIEPETMSFDKLVAVTRLAEVTDDGFAMTMAPLFDVSGIRRLAGRRKVTADDERETADARYLVMQPNLDRSSWRTWGLLTGVDGAAVEKALVDRADQFPTPPDCERDSIGRRMADALTSICQDSLDGNSGIGGAVPDVTVFVDADALVDGDSVSGVRTGTGHSVGPRTLEELLCVGTISVVATDGLKPVATSRRTRAIPRSIRHFVARRDQGRCTADGCSSRYRLQPHHIVPFSQGGDHHPDNLATLCWYHHHIVVHANGFEIDPATPTHRRRFYRSKSGTDPPI